MGRRSPLENARLRSGARTPDAQGEASRGGGRKADPGGYSALEPCNLRRAPEKLRLSRKPTAKRAQSGTHLVSEIAECGNCAYRLYRTGNPVAMTCKSRPRGLTDCEPSPTIHVSILEGAVTNRFLANYGDHMFMETVYDPGNGNEEKLEGLRAARRRLRDDREAGLYDDAEDAEWFQSRYASFDVRHQEDGGGAHPARGHGLSSDGTNRRDGVERGPGRRRTAQAAARVRSQDRSVAGGPHSALRDHFVWPGGKTRPLFHYPLAR